MLEILQVASWVLVRHDYHSDIHPPGHPPHSLTNNYLETVTGAFTYSYGYLDDVWKVFGTYLEHVWKVSGMCQEVVLNMSGTLLENFWNVFGMYLEVV